MLAVVGHDLHIINSKNRVFVKLRRAWLAAILFLEALARQGLARTTVKGYRSGASALTKALRGARTLPSAFDEKLRPIRVRYARADEKAGAER